MGKYRCESLWTALIDDDEFIVPKSAESVPEILQGFASEGGLAVGWATFGSNGHVTRPSGLVVESFTRRGEHLHKLYKTIVRSDRLERIRVIHYPVFREPYRLVSEHHQVVSLVPERFPSVAQTHNPTGDNIQINHYKSKSREEWARRVARGAVAGGKWRDGLDDFNSLDLNEVEDLSIRRYIPRLKMVLKV